MRASVPAPVSEGPAAAAASVSDVRSRVGGGAGPGGLDHSAGVTPPKDLKLATRRARSERSSPVQTRARTRALSLRSGQQERQQQERHELSVKELQMFYERHGLQDRTRKLAKRKHKAPGKPVFRDKRRLLERSRFFDAIKY